MRESEGQSALESPPEFLDIGHDDPSVEGRVPRRSIAFSVDAMDSGGQSPWLVPCHPRAKIDSGTTIKYRSTLGP